MSPRQRQIIDALSDGEWKTARQLRDLIAPGTMVENIRVQLSKIRSRQTAIEIEAESDIGPASRGYRLISGGAA